MATIIERGPYQFQVKIRRRGRPLISKTFTTKTAAQMWARDVESEMDKGVFLDRRESEKNTLDDVLKRYQEEVTPDKKGATIEKVRIAALRRDPLARLKMAALSGKDVAAWRDRRLKEDKVTGSTVYRELNSRSAVINHARKEWGIHIENPIAMIRRPQNEKARERRLEDGEETALLATLEGSRREDGTLGPGARNPWIKPLVLLALETAMRRGELLALRWEDVDTKRQVARILDSKNGEARSVPLSSRAVAVLEALPRSIDGRVFPTTEDAVKKAFSRACIAAGLKDLHFHDLRHEATSRLAEKLPNVIELAAVTGHKDLRMLKRYYHPRAEDLARKLG
ncbi:MAG: site-specific integrase [Sulfuricellaceae bacterium]